MRATEVGVLFIWSRSRRQFFCCGFSRLLRSPLWLLVVLMLFVRATTAGVGEEIGSSESFDCCGMPLNISKCWTDLACVCEKCANRTRHDAVSYRMEFCSSFPLNEVLNGAFLRNRTFCQEQLNMLQRADNTAYSSYRNFEGVIQRIHCGEFEIWEANTYSATSTCSDCLEAYKNWICFTKLSEAIASIVYPDKTTKSMKRPCLNFCETVLQKCPYLLPTPNDEGNLVQVGYSAFNCVETEEWQQEYKDSDDCFPIDPMVKCKQNNYTSILQPTVTTTSISTSNSTANSTNNGGR